MQGNSKEIQSRLRSSRAAATPAAGAYCFGPFALHPTQRQLYRAERRIVLPPKAFDALLLLVRNAERLVRKDELMRALWPDTFVEEANLTNTVVTLRKVLGRTSIETVSKFGYRLVLPVTGEPGVDPEVYATFLRARQQFAIKTPDAARTARDLFLLCVTKDPSFAAAWAWLGRCYRFLEKFGVDPTVNADLAHEAFRRALAIDPANAAAHQFFTNLQVDWGQAREAMVRLAARVAGVEDAASYAGLVQALRFCGLLRESVAAHTRALALDPAIETGVMHTYFLLCDYQAAIAHYPPALKYYLDVAAWAAAGNVDQARHMLDERLSPGRALSPVMRTLLTTLRFALAGDRAAVVRDVAATNVMREPESLFYLARHSAMVGAADQAVPIIMRARTEGFVSSYALRHQAAFAPIRNVAEFQQEIAAALAAEDAARRSLGTPQWLIA